MRHELERDPAVWDAFVAAAANPSYLQVTAWAAIKAPNGWGSLRVAVGGARGPIGAQVLVQRPRPSPWGMGYVPRGPVSTESLTPSDVSAFTERLHKVARVKRLAYVRIEPEVEAGAGVEEALRSAGWFPAPHVQPETTRIIDISVPEGEVWGGLHRKARQSVNKSARQGVRVVDGDASRLNEFYAIHTEAMRRAGISPRAEQTYRDMWDELAPRGMARLLFAEITATGAPVATLFLVSCGHRVVDLYGGTTQEGGDRRANYLLKWEAIKRCREWGLREYDLWGLPREGIARFKSGFGGREIRYIGAWDLQVDPVGRRLLLAGERGRDTYRRWRYREVHRPEDDGAGIG